MADRPPIRSAGPATITLTDADGKETTLPNAEVDFQSGGEVSIDWGEDGDHSARTYWRSTDEQDQRRLLAMARDPLHRTPPSTKSTLVEASFTIRMTRFRSPPRMGATRLADRPCACGERRMFERQRLFITTQHCARCGAEDGSWPAQSRWPVYRSERYPIQVGREGWAAHGPIGEAADG